MNGGINLHDVVRGPITYLHPDEAVLWYRATGQTNDRGKIVSSYADPVELMAQIQSDGPDETKYAHRLGDSELSSAFYLYSPSQGRVAGVVRPEARGGDFLYRCEDRTWWLVTAVKEDFASVEWEKVIAVWQVVHPDIPDPEAEESEGEDTGDTEDGTDTEEDGDV